MTVPYTLLIVKPMSVGRGDAPEILSKILTDCPVSLRQFRQWVICDNTLHALSQDTGPITSDLNYEQEVIHTQAQRPSWICVFTHKDRLTDPTELLNEYCGPLDSSKWIVGQLRNKYSGRHSTDNVVHISKEGRSFYEANMLFTDFDENKI